jgi:hypothetical protein
MTRAGPMEKREIWIQVGVILAEHGENPKAPSRLELKLRNVGALVRKLRDRTRSTGYHD